MRKYDDWVEMVFVRGEHVLQRVRSGMCRILNLVRDDMTPLARAGLEVADAYWGGRQVPGRGMDWYYKEIVQEFADQGPGYDPYFGPMRGSKFGARRLGVLYVLKCDVEGSVDALYATEFFSGEIENMELDSAEVERALGDPYGH
ncbi:MAG: hypothetical protein KA020_16130 [Planctomycetes bacterium]|nr:hypothetical protein [Planctomycetota bacterium]